MQWIAPRVAIVGTGSSRASFARGVRVLTHHSTKSLAETYDRLSNYELLTPDDLAARKDDAYQGGKEDVNEAGRKEGIEEGKRRAQENNVKPARQAGHQNGYLKGYNHGHETGLAEGKELGRADGHDRLRKNWRMSWPTSGPPSRT